MEKLALEPNFTIFAFPEPKCEKLAKSAKRTTFEHLGSLLSPSPPARPGQLWETSGERFPDVSQSWPGRAGGEGDKREPRCSKVVSFALLANFSHFGSENVKMVEFCSKAHFFHFWLPKVAKYHYVYKPFCIAVQKV